MRVVWCVLIMTASVAAFGAETTWWSVDSADAMMAGRGSGVAVTEGGQLRPVPRWTLTTTFDEPVALAGDRLPGGDLVVATGHPARLYRVDGGRAELLAELPAEQATAVLARRDGSVWVATMAPARLLHWHDGELETVGQLGEGAIWDLVEFDGRVVAAAGPPASLYRVTDQGLMRWLELPDGFARSLAVDGEVLVVGTSGEGLIVRVDTAGRPAILVDSPFTEISALAPAGDGSLWATSLVGEPVATKKPASSNGESEVETETASLDLDLPKINGKTATSELLRITPDGGVLSVHRFVKQVASALAVDGDGVLVGTGYEGELWRFTQAGGTRLVNLDAVHVVAFAGGPEAMLTQGPASLFERQGGEESGRFRSAVEKYDVPVRFGRFRVLGSGADGRIRFRSGASTKDQPIWLEWTQWQPATEGAVGVPLGRVLQWELELAPGSAVEAVHVASRQVNLPPRITEMEVEPPGVVYLSAPPSSGPVIREDHPTFSGLFTTLGADSKPSPTSAKGQKHYQVGYRTVGWKATDANDDPLRFALDLEDADGRLVPVRRDLEATVLAVDTTAVPDGRYRFRVTASDGSANPADPRTAEAISPWFEVDSTPPRIEVERGDDGWSVVVRDSSPVTRVEASLDGETWLALAPADGVLDGGVERFSVPRPESGSPSLGVVRAFDRHHNRTAVALPGGGTIAR